MIKFFNVAFLIVLVNYLSATKVLAFVDTASYYWNINYSVDHGVENEYLLLDNGKAFPTCTANDAYASNLLGVDSTGGVVLYSGKRYFIRTGVDGRGYIPVTLTGPGGSTMTVEYTTLGLFFENLAQSDPKSTPRSNYCWIIEAGGYYGAGIERRMPLTSATAAISWVKKYSHSRHLIIKPVVKLIAMSDNAWPGTYTATVDTTDHSHLTWDRSSSYKTDGGDAANRIRTSINLSVTVAMPPVVAEILNKDVHLHSTDDPDLYIGSTRIKTASFGNLTVQLDCSLLNNGGTITPADGEGCYFDASNRLLLRMNIIDVSGDKIVLKHNDALPMATGNSDTYSDLFISVQGAESVGAGVYSGTVNIIFSQLF